MYGRFDFQTIFYLFIQNWSQAKCISFFDFIFSFYLHDQKILIVSMVLFCFFFNFFIFLFFFPEIDLCASHPCENNGTCKNFRTYYTCSCPPGFQGVNCETGEEIRWADSKYWDKTFVTRVIVYDLEVKFYKCCEQKTCNAYCYKVDFDSENSEVLWIEKYWS